MFPSCFSHFSLLSKLAQGNLEQRNCLLEVFQSFQQHFVAFHDVTESSRRYRAHLKLKHCNKSLFFLSSKSQIWTYLSHECRKDKDRKRIFNLDKNILFKKGKNICTVIINQLQFHIFLNTWLKFSQSLFLNRLASPVFSLTLYFKIRSVVRLPATPTTTWPLQQTYRTFVLQSPFSFV